MSNVPEWLSSLRLRVRAIFHRQQLERDLRDEMAFHLAMREEQLRESGAGHARAAARQRFGSVAKVREQLQDTWSVAPTMDSILRDLRYAARALRSAPGFAVVVILTLGLGIGANTAFFTVVNAVLIRPLGYAHPDRLVSVYEAFSQAGIDRIPFSALDYADFRARQQTFESIAAYRNVPFELSEGEVPERIFGAKASFELFHVLGVDPIVGRAFAPTEDSAGSDDVALLSWGLWQRRYGGKPSIIGQRIQLDRRPYTVIGIMPAGFTFPQRGAKFNAEPADVWVPIAFTEADRPERGTMHVNSVVARLKDGGGLATASAELEVLGQGILKEYPQILREAGFSLRLHAQPLRQEISGRYERPLLLLLAAVGLVLLVACANVANLVLSRAAGRTRELAVRTALGARRRQLAQLLLCEALLLSAGGGLVGIAMAYGSVKAAPAVLTRTIPGLQNLTLDLRVLAFTAVVSLATTAIVALVCLPSLDARAPVDALREHSSRASSGRRALRVQRGLVVLTVGMACVLLIGAGLLLRSFGALVTTDFGFRSAGVLTAQVTLPSTFYATAAGVRNFYDTLTTTLGSVPGVRSVALTTDLPFTLADLRTFTAEGSSASTGAPATTNLTWVHGPYFETFGMTLVRGRFFDATEHAQVRGVMVVNEKLAELAWPGQDPVGKRLKWGPVASRAPWMTVVGVIRNVTDGSIGAEPGVHAYVPFRLFPDVFLNRAATSFGRSMNIAILATQDPRTLAALVRREVSQLDPKLAVERLQTMDQNVSDVVAPQRFSAFLATGFAALALLLAAVGLYGLLAYAAAQRRKEIAVRLALGAARRDVIGMVIGEGVGLVALGIVLGVFASFAVTRGIASLLYRTSPHDLVALAIVPAVLLPVAFLACAIPAWRAARFDPIVTLRMD